MRKQLLCITAFLLLAAGSFLLADGCWIRTKAVFAQLLLQHAWEETLETGEWTKAWPWADTWPVARLQMDRLGVDLIVLEGDHGEVLAFGPGHLPESSLPGSGGHCILAGHRDSSFRFLQDLQPGDLLSLQGADGRVHCFEMQSSQVSTAETLYLQQQDSAALTLITCYPFSALQPGTDLRYLVSAEKLVLPETTGLVPHKVNL